MKPQREVVPISVPQSSCRVNIPVVSENKVVHIVCSFLLEEWFCYTLQLSLCFLHSYQYSSIFVIRQRLLLFSTTKEIMSFFCSDSCDPMWIEASDITCSLVGVKLYKISSTLKHNWLWPTHLHLVLKQELHLNVCCLKEPFKKDFWHFYYTIF